MALGRQLASGLCLLVAAGVLLGCGDSSDAEIPPGAASNLEQKLDRIQERANAGNCTGPDSATSSLESLREAMGTEPLSSIDEGLAADLEELFDRLAEQLARDCEPAEETTTEETTSELPATTEPTTTEPPENTTTKTTTRTTTTRTTTTRQPPPDSGPPDNGGPDGNGGGKGGNPGNGGGANGGVGPGRDRSSNAGGGSDRAGATRQDPAGFAGRGSKGGRDR